MQMYRNLCFILCHRVHEILNLFLIKKKGWGISVCTFRETANHKYKMQPQTVLLNEIFIFICRQPLKYSQLVYGLTLNTKR